MATTHVVIAIKYKLFWPRRTLPPQPYSKIKSFILPSTAINDLLCRYFPQPDRLVNNFLRFF